MSNAKQPAPTPCTCAMLRRTARRVSQIYDQALRPVGLRLGQYSVLAIVAQTEGLSVTELAERLAMDRSTLTRNLRPLVRSRWIRIEAGADHRQRAVALTDAGRAKFEEAMPVWQATERQLRRALGRAETERLRALLDRVLAQADVE